MSLRSSLLLSLVILACSGASRRRVPGDAGDASSGGQSENAAAGSASSSAGGNAKAGATGTASGAGGDGGAAGASGGTDPELVEFWYRYDIAQCDFDERCAEQNGRLYVNRETCLEYADYMKSILEAYNPDPYSTYRVDPAFVAACIADVFPADSCDARGGDKFQLESCRRAFVWNDPVPAGGPCETRGSGRACDYGLECVADDDRESGCGVCRAEKGRQPDGADCASYADCQSLSCATGEGGSGECAPRAARGAPCADSTNCRGYLYCQNGRCEERAGLGESCSDEAQYCQNGLRCDTEAGQCVAMSGRGTPCDRSGSADCFLFCSFDSPDAALGTCGLGEDPTEGKPCAYSGTEAVCTTGRPERVLGPDGVDESCICGPLPGIGERCTYDWDCASNACGGYDPANPNAERSCVSAGLPGASCETGWACVSGACSAEHRCLDAPMCHPGD